MRRAALTGGLLALLMPFSGEARTSSKPKSASASRPKSAPVSTKPKAAKHHRRKAKVVVHQDETGKVVSSRVARLGPADLPFYGPFLPAEPNLYPQPLCQEVDVVLEALVHEESPAATEGQVEPEAARAGLAASEGVRVASAEALSHLAEKVGSLLRPKTSSAKIKPQDVDLGDLLEARLQIPVEGADVEKLRDSFLASRGRHRKHLAIDIGAPRGTPVLATSDGEVVKTPREKRGGRTIYLKDRSGQYLFYYAHLSRYASGVAAGRKVAKGEVIGYVGSTGHVVGGPHLHFSIARVPDDEDTQREGLAINPYLLFLASVP